VYCGESLEDFVYNWNNNFPIDRWWRQKHQIPFNSPVHRDSCFIDMYFEFLEDRLWEKVVKSGEKERDEDRYIPGRRDLFKKVRLTQEEIDDQFDKIDISKLNENLGDE